MTFEEGFTMKWTIALAIVGDCSGHLQRSRRGRRV